MQQLTLYVHNEDTLRKSQVKRGSSQSITIGMDQTHTFVFSNCRETLAHRWNGEVIILNNQELRQGEKLQSGQFKYYLQSSNEHIYDLVGLSTWTIGPSPLDTIQLLDSDHAAIFTKPQNTVSYECTVIHGAVFLNGQRIEYSQPFLEGDLLFIDGVLFTVRNSEIVIISGHELMQTKQTQLFEQHREEEFNRYQRSPRVIYREPTEDKIIATPPHKPAKPSEQLGRVIVPPIVMIAVLILVSFFRPTGIYIVVMLSMTIVTIIYAILSYVRNVKKYKQGMKEREEKFNIYLKQKTKELHEVYVKQNQALAYHFPSVSKITQMLTKRSARMYEKTPFHHDFLSYRIGIGTVDSSFQIKLNTEEFTLEEDELMEKAIELEQQFNELERAPITVDLMQGAIGYIGKRSLVLEQLQMTIAQLAFFHSYHEVQFITVFPEEEKHYWQWMRWLPHANLRDVNVRAFVYHERSRDQVLNSLYQYVKERKQFITNNAAKEAKVFIPQLVLVITDEKIIMDHAIMEFLNEDTKLLGLSVIYVQDVLQSLPEHVQTVIDIKDSKQGELFIQNGELIRKTFQLDRLPSLTILEEMARRVASYEHVQNLKNRIPESVTYLEMYKASSVAELSILRRWQQNAPYKSLSVPLGLRGKDDLVYLNLHEKAHGPHGLIAGTTGSGKSEIIQSYILSLATNFHPYDIGFLLIDYKGGGMANLFKQLPHVLGVITNLDGAQSMRALASIKAELQKRQRIFNDHEVNHIHQYQKLYASKKVQEPMPELFIISDEFAELKSEQPEFMKELVSTARIGRSLGIHLILATQKPSGVVDDQIWSNSKFKLALKVQNESDSNEILKTKDAADITLPGRAYLQVGHNEIYELFQSAWSGASYKADQPEDEVDDLTIYEINEIGQLSILTEDLSGLDKRSTPKQQETELEAVIQEIDDLVQSQCIASLPRPWLPPLEERISRYALEKYAKEQVSHANTLRATIGLLDLPHLQEQEPLTIDFTKNGHIAIFSSPGFGKSTLLQTLALEIAERYTPEQVHYYLLDFGTNGLLPIRQLPQVADLIRIDEEMKLQKWIKRMHQLLKERKQLLSEYGVTTLMMYREVTKEKVPEIVVFLDMVDAVQDLPAKEAFDQLFTQLAREGASVGIYLALTGSRQFAIRSAILVNIKTQISLYMIDKSETRNIIGKSDIDIEEMPGRALIKLEQPSLMQIALPADGDDDIQVAEQVRQNVLSLRENWEGPWPQSIPMVPETVSQGFFNKLSTVEQAFNQKLLPFAVDVEEVQAVSFDWREDKNILIMGETIKQFTQAFEAILSGIEQYPQWQLVMIDQVAAPYLHLQKFGGQYVQQLSEVTDLIDQLQDVLKGRQEDFEHQQSTGSGTLFEYVQSLNPIIILFTDLATINEGLSTTTQATLAKLLDKGALYGIHFILGVLPQMARGYDDVSVAVKKQKTALLTIRLNDQNLMDVQRPYKEKELLPYESYLVRSGKVQKVKVVIGKEIEVNV